MAKSNTIKSSHVRFGRRTYFFDINLSANNKKYLKITESKFLGEGKDRQYNSFILFPEDVVEFEKNLKEMAGSLSEK
ncbi:MAG: DUF3276 family protein [Candidatus Levybacteria bacterium]|nr:DUF3276 family protein [Candidatus Levybacteria bacterium]